MDMLILQTSGEDINVRFFFQNDYYILSAQVVNINSIEQEKYWWPLPQTDKILAVRGLQPEKVNQWQWTHFLFDFENRNMWSSKQTVKQFNNYLRRGKLDPFIMSMESVIMIHCMMNGVQSFIHRYVCEKCRDLGAVTLYVPHHPVVEYSSFCPQSQDCIHVLCLYIVLYTRMCYFLQIPGYVLTDEIIFLTNRDYNDSSLKCKRISPTFTIS